MPIIHNVGEYQKERKTSGRALDAQHTPPQPYLIEPKMTEILLNFKNSKENIVELSSKNRRDFISSLKGSIPLSTARNG